MESVSDEPRICSGCQCWTSTLYVCDECIKTIEPEMHFDEWSDERLVRTIERMLASQRTKLFKTDVYDKQMFVQLLLAHKRFKVIPQLIKYGLNMSITAEGCKESGIVSLIRQGDPKSVKLFQYLLQTGHVNLKKEYDGQTLWKWACAKRSLRHAMCMLQYAQKERIEPYASLGGTVSQEIQEMIESISRQLRESFVKREWTKGTSKIVALGISKCVT